MSDSEHDDDRSIEGEDEVNENMRVFLRLRPMNKLETSRRSKNCIDLHEDPRSLTVDSPLEGEYDFYFDHVFEEYASQDEVFEHAVSPVPSKLLEGYNCSVIAYGQTGTGKTHTMLGDNGGPVAMLQMSKRDSNVTINSSTSLTDAEVEVDTLKPQDAEGAAVDTEAEGMIARTVNALFALIQESSPTIEYTIRCSYVEIYLEKILDLLNPGGMSGGVLSIVDDLPADEAAGVGIANHSGGVRVVGAAELCCLDASDVFGLLARGNACRTMSSTEMNTDSSRSHAIFIMTIEQRDLVTKTMTKSVLHMIDLAGSEMATTQGTGPQRAGGGGSAVQTEAKMINKSLSALARVIRGQLENQHGGNVSVAAASRHSKLTRLLRPSFGGNCITTLILTASSSSYNIGETISTIRFGQRCRRVQNLPIVNAECSPAMYRKQLAESERKRDELMSLVKALATECQTLKMEGTRGSDEEDSHKGPIWNVIEDLLQGSAENSIDVSQILRQQDGRTGDTEGLVFDDGIVDAVAELALVRKEVQKLREELVVASNARDIAENSLADLQSVVAVLRTQNENLMVDKQKNMQELIDAKNEVQVLSQRKIEVEHNLRTSQFRENEAIVFLRQFRRFYRNVLRDKAKHGSGSIKEITQEIASKAVNAPDLSQLVDVDRLLFESGLIEEHEMNDDRSGATTAPTKAALLRSASAAQKAAAEAEAMEKEYGSAIMSGSIDGDGSSYANSSSVNSSIRQMGILNMKTDFESLDAISEIGDGGVSQYARGDRGSGDESRSNDDASSIGERKVEGNSVVAPELNETKRTGAGADAGAGSSSSVSVTDSSFSQSITRGRGSGAMIAKRQTLLRTPSGRLTTMREKDLEAELLVMSERCIDLQMALNEEKAMVDQLNKNPGALSKKRLAQEAIALRQQLEKMHENLMAIAWKMNELNLINKSYTERMVEREQHVVYIEEELTKLQTMNRRLIEEGQETEKKLRDEVECLKKVVAGITVPLWQFGARSTCGRSVVSRIVVPFPGGTNSAEIESQAPVRKLSEGESEPSLSLHDIGLGDNDGASQVDPVVVVVDKDGTDSLVESTAQSVVIETMDAEVQTDEEPRIEKNDVEIQTEALERQDASVQAVEPTIPKEEVYVQTDIVECTDIGTGTDPWIEPSGNVDSSSEGTVDIDNERDRSLLAVKDDGSFGNESDGKDETDHMVVASTEALASASHSLPNPAEVPTSRDVETNDFGQTLAMHDEDENSNHGDANLDKNPAHEASNALPEVKSLSYMPLDEEQQGSNEESKKSVDNEFLETEEDVDGNLIHSIPWDAIVLGGRSNDFEPRRFVRKLGPKIKPGVMKEGKKASREEIKNTEEIGSRKKSTSESRKKSEDKKKKKKKTESNKKSSRDGHGEKDGRAKRSRNHHKSEV